MIKFNRKVTSKYLFIFVLLLIIFYIFVNMYQIGNLNQKGYDILPINEIQCIRSICVNSIGLNECIFLKRPMLMKKNNVRSYSANVYELRFDFISDKCE